MTDFETIWNNLSSSIETTKHSNTFFRDGSLNDTWKTHYIKYGFTDRSIENASDSVPVDYKKAFKQSYFNALTELSEKRILNEDCHPALKDDEGYMLIAVELWGQNLKHAGPNVKKNIIVILAAFNGPFGSSMAYVDSSLQCDKNVVMHAVKLNDSRDFTLLHPSMKKDRDVAFEFLSSHPNDFDMLDIELQNDHNFIADLITNNPKTIKSIKETNEQSLTAVLLDKEFAHNLIINHYDLFKSLYYGSTLSKQLFADKKILLSAIAVDPEAYRHAPLDTVLFDAKLHELAKLPPILRQRNCEELIAELRHKEERSATSSSTCTVM